MRRIVGSGFAFVLAVCPVFFSLLTASLHAQQRQVLQTHVSAPAGAKLVGRMPSSQQLNLAITLPLRNQEQLQTLLRQLEDPNSPNYHQYLTSAQFTQQFGPTVVEYQQVIGFAQSHGLTVTHTSPSRRLLNVTGSVANVEQTFQVTMQVYQHPTESRTYYAPNVEPTVEAGISVLGVSGLTNFTLPHSMLTHASTVGGGSVHSDQTGSGPNGQFLGSDMRAAYYGTGPLAGSGQAIALAELGPWNISDVQAYFNSLTPPQQIPIPIVSELTGGNNGQCIGLPGNGCDDGEEVIDIEQIVSMAPSAPVLIVYTDYTNNADVDIFDAYSTDNIAKQMSWSFGIGDGNAVSDEGYFATFHAQGQNFFVASGDAGAFDGTGGWPGFSSNVTDVGGTDLTTNGAGGPWLSETTWTGSGGGWCDSSNVNDPCNNFPQYDGIPSYQSQAGVITAGNEGSTLYRNVPDVAAEANVDNWFCANGGCFGGIGGTSLAAPRWAGFLALVNEQAAENGETVGWLNPTVYTIGLGTNYSTAFHDITTVGLGGNGYPVVAGYDIVTGWGTPNSQGMINALAPTGGTNPYFTLAASPAALNLTPGGASQTATISLTPANGFSGTVALTASVLGAPAGVTASVSPLSITGTGTSTLTVTADSSTNSSTFVSGNVEVVVVGTSSGGIQTQPAFVTLGLPDYALSATPTGIYLNQAATATSTVTVTPQYGFNGSVTLSSVTGLPTGVTGAFNPAIITSATPSTLTLTASSTAATGPSSGLNIFGASGNISQYAPATTLAVSAATGTGGSGTPVSLTSAYNLPGIYADGITFGTGLDGSGYGYSSTLLTPNRILNGVQFSFGPANTASCAGSGQPACANNAVSSAGQVITLPSGQFTTLQLLATATNGPITSQTITVTYTDNTTSTFTQSFSDWCSCSGSTPGPGHQPGESFAVVMPYRDAATGTQDDRPFNLYAYTFLLNNAKTVQSLTLPPKPSTGEVVVLAATLTTQSLGAQVSLSSEYNIAGIFANNVTFEGTGDIDGTGDTDSCTLSSGCSDAYSEQQLGLTSATSPTLTINGLVFNLGTVNTTDCGTGLPACTSDAIDLPTAGVTIPLPSGQQSAYATLSMLGTAVNGGQTGTVTITYTTGSPQTINQAFSDWCGFGSNPNESIAVGGINRINSDGTLAAGVSCNLYSYTYTLDPTRIAQSIALTYTGSTSNGSGAFVFAITLSGNSTSTPGYTLSAAPSSLSVAQGGNNTSTITVNPSGGFTGSVSLAVTSTLPSGVTASFNPTSTTGTSTLTLTASSAATTGGPTTVTVTGTSGTLALQTATIGLTVTPPESYSLSAGTASPASISPGATSTAAITVTSTNNYAGSVTLSCSISPVVSPAPTCSFGNTSPVTVTSTGGSATLTFTTVGASGAMIRHSNMLYALWLPLPGIALIGLGLGSRSPRRKKLLGFLLLWMLLASLIILPACGSSSSRGGGGGGNSGTPAGTYTITITGKDANGVTQSNTAPAVTVTVN